MITKCTGVSTDFSKIAVGEALWMPGHIGVYIGNGLAIECTPSWKNRVQITAVKNIGTKAGYNARKWDKHGKLPYIDYEKEETKVANIKKDNTPDKYAKDAVEWAVKEGILKGTEQGDYKLHSNITRQDMLVFLYRAMH